MGEVANNIVNYSEKKDGFKNLDPVLIGRLIESLEKKSSPKTSSIKPILIFSGLIIFGLIAYDLGSRLIDVIDRFQNGIIAANLYDVKYCSHVGNESNGMRKLIFSRNKSSFDKWLDDPRR